MRYDNRITFVAEVQGAYDDATGNYAAPTLMTVIAYAKIVEGPPAEINNFKYGGKRKGILHAHLQNGLKGILPQYALIDGDRYQIMETRYGGTYYLLGREVV